MIEALFEPRKDLFCLLLLEASQNSNLIDRITILKQVRTYTI